MDSRILRYFIAVYEEMSLSAAAKRCLVSQPSVSAAIRQLESELEQPLFIRHPKGATPTEAGKAVYPYALKKAEYKRMIPSADSLVRVFKSFISAFILPPLAFRIAPALTA